MVIYTCSLVKTFCLNFLPVPFFIVTFCFVGTLYKWLISHKPKWQMFSHSVNCLFILLILFKKLCFLLLTCFVFLWLTCFCVMFYICIHSHEDILQFSFFSLIFFSETTLSVFLALRALVSGFVPWPAVIFLWSLYPWSHCLLFCVCNLHAFLF